MKAGQKLWSRDELILAINLYCKLPFGKMHKGTPEVIELARLIGRTPSSVGLKLGNFASFDPSLKARGVKGASNASKLDKKIWDEFYNNWDEAILESETQLAIVKNTSVEKLNNLEPVQYVGHEKERTVKTRVNQAVFRKIILATYNNTCCISGIDTPELLIASHIVPWSIDKKNRLNPMNGLCLNAILDKAFDVGLMTVSAVDYKIVISEKLKKKNPPISIQENFLNHDGCEIKLPDRFLPSKELLKIHNDFFIS